MDFVLYETNLRVNNKHTLRGLYSHENGHENGKENGHGNGQENGHRNKHGQGKRREINETNLVS